MHLRIIIVVTLLSSIRHGWAEPIRLSSPTAFDSNSETFGQIFDDSKADLDLVTLMKDPSKYLGQQLVVKTSIAKVCQKKGCFFIAQQNQSMLRVSFKDYSFFIPTDSSGKTVTLAGELVEKQVTPAQAAHFSADLNTESVALKAGKAYEIVASGIQIPRDKNIP
jgi:hypothetical protein